MSISCLLTNQFTREVDSSGNSVRASQVYCVSGTDADTAIAMVRSRAPEAIGRAGLDRIEIIGNPGEKVYRIEAVYRCDDRYESGRGSDKKAGDRNWRFYASTANTRITRALGIKKTVVAQGAPPALGNVNGLINWNGLPGAESMVCGTDKLTAVMRETCVATWQPSRLTTAYKRRIMALVGCVNSNAFNGWAAGEVLFIGASQGAEYLNRDRERLVDVSYSFAIRPNRTSLRRGGLDLGAAGGWEYDWDISRLDPVENIVKTEAAYLMQIYPSKSFAPLGL